MPFSLLPKLVTEKLTDITPALLKREGIRLLMLDFDNTIVQIGRASCRERV